MLCLGGSLLIHAAWFCCSPPLPVSGPVSAPVEIGWLQLPPEAVSPAIEPSPEKPVSEKTTPSTAVLPRPVTPGVPRSSPASETAPAISTTPMIPPATSAVSGPAGMASAATEEAAPDGSPASGVNSALAVNPAAETFTGPARVEAVPLAGDNPPPVYPRLARQRGWEGLVSLKVRVSAGGEVEEVWVESTSGHGVLDQAALTAVKGWRFQPAREGVQAVAGVARVPIEFRLRGG